MEYGQVGGAMKKKSRKETLNGRGEEDTLFFPLRDEAGEGYFEICKKCLGLGEKDLQTEGSVVQHSFVSLGASEAWTLRRDEKRLKSWEEERCLA